MQDEHWGGGYAGHHDPRYHPQQSHPSAPRHAAPAQSQGVHYAAHATPQGVSPHWVAPHADDQAPGAPAHGGGMGRILHGAGALLSVALIAGLGVWGYQLAMRDVTGVPVVRALEGPMRIQPDNPGGEAAAHQGLAVNSVAAEGQAEGPAPQVALAPAPVALEDEDLPVRDEAEVSAVALAEVSAAPMAEAGDAVPADAPDPLAPAAALPDADEGEAEVAAALALADAIAAEAAPLSGDAANLELTPEAEVRMAAALVPANVPGVARSPRPAPRPDDLVARAAASPVELAVASAVANAPQSVREVDATQIASGTRLVQLGAFDSADVARAEWDKVALRFPDMLDGKDRVIEMAQSGGKTFYRLRAMGFADLSDARRFCAALMAGQAACIPVVTR